METRQQYIEGLRNELAQLGREIEKHIVRINKLSVDINQGFEELETDLMDQQELTRAKLEESSLSGDQVWHFVWDKVWDAVNEHKTKATPEIHQKYSELEPALQAKQSVLEGQLQVSKMSGDEVWNAVWKAVWKELWNLIEAFNQQAATKIKQVGEELQPLLDKQAALQSELHEILMAGDAFYKVLKGTTEAIVKR